MDGLIFALPGWEPTEGPGSGDDRYRFRPGGEECEWPLDMIEENPAWVDVELEEYEADIELIEDADSWQRSQPDDPADSNPWAGVGGLCGNCHPELLTPEQRLLLMEAS